MYKNRMLRPVRSCFKKGAGGIRKSNREDELDQSTLCACMETSE
jgi:hypothetical protein